MALHKFPDAGQAPMPAPITGYRTLTAHDVQVVNDIKSYEADIARLSRLVQRHIEDSTGLPRGTVLLADHPNHERNRQLAIARAEFEVAFMRLVRAVTNPVSPWVLGADAKEATKLTARDEQEAFLLRITAMVNRRDAITREEIARLKALANWADVPPAPGWDGTYNREAVLQAVNDARKRIEKEFADGT